MNFRDESLTIKERVTDLISRLTVEEKMGFLTSTQQAVERLGIKERSIGTEFARGWSSHEETEYCTVFPQTIGMAQTFNEKLIHEAGEIAAKESRAYYNSINKSLFGFGPTVDLERDPRWGRHEEGYGEDPCLTEVMSTSYTKGLVGDGKVKKTLPILKHFICNNTETDRATYDIDVSERLLNEYYLEVFRKPIVEGSAFGVMGAYNKINGEPGLLSGLNQKYVKDAWGGKLVVSDGHGFAMVMEEHKYTKSNAKTMALALERGANIMLDAPDMVISAAKEAYEQKLIDEALIDRAIEDTLTLRFMLGEFDANDPYENITMDLVNTDEDKKVSLKMAEEQVILLKNDGILPLDSSLKDTGKTIALIGPEADENFLDWYTGASSYDLTIKDGFDEKLCKPSRALCDSGRDIVRIKDVNTGLYVRVLDDMSVKVDASKEDAASFEKYDWGSGCVNFMDTKSGKMLEENENVIKCTAKDAYMWFVRPILTPHETDGGIYFTSWNKKDIALNEDNELYLVENEKDIKFEVFEIEVISEGDERCEKLAKEADVCIVCLGNHPTQVGREGFDRDSIALPPRQDMLAKRVHAVNPNTILLMVSSYPYGVDYFDENLRAVVYTTHAGPELGRAVANIFFGEANPSGRLASTWYKNDFRFPSIFDYDIEKNKMTYLYLDEEVLYPFGFGLSYSEFKYSDFKIIDDKDDAIIFSVNVSNTSSRDGDEVVQIYYTRNDSKYQRPKKKLAGFSKETIKAGETKEVFVTASKDMLKSFDETKEKMVLEEGEYAFHIGKNSENFLLDLCYRV